MTRTVLGELRVCHRNTTLRPAEVKQRNLELVTSILEMNDIPYFVVRNWSNRRFRVGMESRFRARALEAFRAASAHRPLYIRLGPSPEDVSVFLLREFVGATEDSFTSIPSMRIYEYFATPRSNLVLGARFGCDVEFWSQEEGVLLAPSRNRITEELAGPFAEQTTLEIGGKPYPSVRAFTERAHPEEIDFPVDVVYTWVDGEDPSWRESKERAMAGVEGSPFIHALGTNKSRFHSRDELRYSMRSLSMYAPFVRHVYLVTAGQTPPWLNTSCDRLTVVNHKELFGDVGKLPTFNSHAIESRLHHIEGLSEHYLYVNDDVFFGRYISPKLFFAPNGLSYFFLSRRQIPLGPPVIDDLPVASAAKNGRELLRERFGKSVTQRFKHVPHPQQRSVHLEMESIWSEHFARVAATQFRSATDISIASALHHYFAFFTTRAIAGEIEYAYVDLSDEAQLEERLKEVLKTRALDTFCLNDTDAMPLDEERHVRIVQDFLERYFPIKSEFEL